MKIEMYAVVVGESDVYSLHQHEAEAWIVVEDFDADGSVWVAVVDVELGALVNVTSDLGHALTTTGEFATDRNPASYIRRRKVRGEKREP